MAAEVKLPELGENLEGGDVLDVKVKVGDPIDATIASLDGQITLQLAVRRQDAGLAILMLILTPGRFLRAEDDIRELRLRDWEPRAMLKTKTTIVEKPLFPAIDIHKSQANAQRVYNERVATPQTLRTQEQVARFFVGLELVDPGLVQVHQWRPGPGDSAPEGTVSAHGAVARKAGA